MVCNAIQNRPTPVLPDSSVFGFSFSKVDPLANSLVDSFLDRGFVFGQSSGLRFAREALRGIVAKLNFAMI